MPAGPTLEREAARLQASATEEGGKLVLDESGQPPLLLHSLSELGPVLGDTLVERGLFRPPAGVSVGAVGGRLEKGGVRWQAHPAGAVPVACPESGR